MKRTLTTLLLSLSLTAAPAFADDYSGRAAVGGAVGGALGAYLGAEVDGRTGAIVGGGLGAAAGTAIATDGYREPRRYRTYPYYRHDGDRYYRDRYRYDYRPRLHNRHPHHGRFCPPGQAKKGRCW
jgi:hypothetical protein